MFYDSSTEHRGVVGSAGGEMGARPRVRSAVPSSGLGEDPFHDLIVDVVVGVDLLDVIEIVEGIDES